MYYVNFDNNGVQAETRWFDGVTPNEDGWYQADIDIIGKRYKLVDGKAVEMTAEEISQQNDSILVSTSLVWIREERDRRLLESDWTVNPQVPMSQEKAAAWSDYREKLRNFPLTITAETLKVGAELNWPVRPS